MEKKLRVIKRDKFFKGYLKAYREGCIALGIPNHSIDEVMRRVEVICNDFEKQMKFNGVNFIKNEDNVKSIICDKCNTEYKTTSKVITLIHKGKYVCGKCIGEYREKTI